jgi:hypothetical protein
VAAVTSEETPDAATLGHELSLRVVLFHDAVATRLGVNTTEHKVLDVIAREPGVSPTRLAEYTGLSNPAVTKIVHRLAGLGFVERHRDVADGRRVALTVTAGYQRGMAGLYGPMIDGMGRLADKFTKAEGEAIARWIAGTAEVMRHATMTLAAGAATTREET